MNAANILEKAAGHLKDRATTYDKPKGERSMAAAVRAFIAITGDGLMNTNERGWLFMVLLKAVRSQQGGFKADNYEDGAAYFALAGETAEIERAPLAELCAKLKACEPKPEQRGWPYLPEATDPLEAQAAVMRAQAEANEGWIEWVGGLCPASVGRNVDLKLRCGEEISFIPAELVSWYHYGNGADVIAYRAAPQC